MIVWFGRGGGVEKTRVLKVEEGTSTVNADAGADTRR